jgi:hypothetical protein
MTTYLTAQPRPSDILTPLELQAELRSAGFRYGDGLDIAYAVICVESGKDAGVTGPIVSYNPLKIGNVDGSIDRGLCQFNSKSHPEVSDDDAYDPAKACVAMRRVYVAGGKSFGPWVAFASGAFRKYLVEAQLCRQLFDCQASK